MIGKKKRKFKPLFKQLVNLRTNVLNKQKLLKFKRKKWEKLIEAYRKKLKWYNKYKVQDPTRHLVSMYDVRPTSYQKRYSITFQTVKRFRIFFGHLSRKYLKNQLKDSNIKKVFKKNINSYFLAKIESRLDAVLYRSKFAFSARHAQQLIKHKKVLVNNKQVTNKNYKLKKGDFVTVSDKSKKMFKLIIFKQVRALPTFIPKYLTINYRTLQILFNYNKEEDSSNFFVNYNFSLDIPRITNNYPYM